MAKRTSGKAKAAEKGQAGRPVRVPDDPTRPRTFRMNRALTTAIRSVSDRFDLRSDALAIELAVAQLLAGLARCDAHPPLATDHVALAREVVAHAAIGPRKSSPRTNYATLLIAATEAAEHHLVAGGHCTADECAALLAEVRKLTPGEALWVVADALAAGG
jgi:hypothetical protein